MPTANYCRKLNIENQRVMRHCDNYDTNLPNKKSLKQLKINGKRENKVYSMTENDTKRQRNNCEWWIVNGERKAPLGVGVKVKRRSLQNGKKSGANLFENQYFNVLQGVKSVNPHKSKMQHCYWSVCKSVAFLLKSSPWPPPAGEIDCVLAACCKRFFSEALCS